MRISEPFRISETAEDVIYSAGNAVKRVASSAQLRIRRFEHGAQEQIRRYPLTSVLTAAAIGVALGGLLVAAMTEQNRTSAWRRDWFGIWQ
jgi:ElaB/YqjD/DUF883 family membrane-anchored ribosome-binding protein